MPNTKWPTTLADVAIGTGFSTSADRQWIQNIDEVRIWGSALGEDQLDDMTGPVVSNVVANPVAIDVLPTVTADVSDETGGTGLKLVEYKVDGAVDWISALPSYPVPGLHTIEVRGTDYAMNTGDPVSTLLAVYDPSAGFVTGGGWIDSPAGADKRAGNESLTGKANFGFVSKYKKGANIPDGQTEFQFKAGNLNFHSTSYDWLVVTGSNFAKFKGVGNIAGEGEYKFQIWAGDNDPDTFRIKIWTEDSGGEIKRYDNVDDQDIGGGSIVVHTGKK